MTDDLSLPSVTISSTLKTIATKSQKSIKVSNTSNSRVKGISQDEASV
jgi:hypothetical protein